jgi:hypothetical protein
MSVTLTHAAMSGKRLSGQLRSGDTLSGRGTADLEIQAPHLLSLAPSGKFLEHVRPARGAEAGTQFPVGKQVFHR